MTALESPPISGSRFAMRCDSGDGTLHRMAGQPLPLALGAVPLVRGPEQVDDRKPTTCSSAWTRNRFRSMAVFVAFPAVMPGIFVVVPVVIAIIRTFALADHAGRRTKRDQRQQEGAFGNG